MLQIKCENIFFKSQSLYLAYYIDIVFMMEKQNKKQKT